MSKPPAPPRQKDDDGKALAEFLRAENAKPNMLTLSEFKRYAVLFQNHTDLTPQQQTALNNLASEYYGRIDAYKPVHVVKSHTDKTVVLRLPNIFTPTKLLSRTRENEQIVSINNKLAQSGASPRDQTIAFGRMGQAFIDEQASNTESIAKDRKQYVEIINELQQIYHGGTSPNDPPVEPLGTDDAEDWEIE